MNARAAACLPGMVSGFPPYTAIPIPMLLMRTERKANAGMDTPRRDG